MFKMLQHLHPCSGVVFKSRALQVPAEVKTKQVMLQLI